MKKLIVHTSELGEYLTNEIELYSTMQLSYGLYEFKLDRLVTDVCRTFNLTKVSEDPPIVTLQNQEGDTIVMMMREDNFG